MIRGTVILILLVVLVRPSYHSSESTLDTGHDEYEVSDGVFRPTHEWQEIKEGQSVPAGLHYRINLQTGLKEAKLLEENEEKETTDVQLSDSKSDFYGHSDRRGAINKSTKLFTRDELREMLKKIKDDSPENVPLLTDTSEGRPSSQSTSESHTTIDELKEMLTFHVDVEIMLHHVQTLVSPNATTDQLISSLEELEYYVHQIDNARDFDILGGLSVVIRLLNHSDSKVQSTAALVLGAATQGNPAVQQLAISYNALPTLLSVLSSSESKLVQRRVLYALGSLLRGQPTISKSFIMSRGIERLSDVADTKEEPVLVKIIILLTDLFSMEGLEENTGITIIDLQSKLFNNGWCVHTSQLLQSDNPVSIEKCVLLMDKLLDVCDYSDQYRLLNKISKQWSRNNEDKELMDVSKNILKRVRTSKEEL